MQQPIYRNTRFTVWPDRVEEGGFVARVHADQAIESNYPMSGTGGAPVARWWRPGEERSASPTSASDQPLLDAVYKLSLEELCADTTEQGLFDAGANWAGVWTRDVSYSILLVLAAIEPERAKANLLARVRSGRILQDPGTGGSWPVSTDRLVWGMAAWEVFLAAGDQAWLQQSYAILSRSVLDDMETVFDPQKGLVRGESSFLDWREQTYPRWMKPVDIYQSYALSTNAIFYRSTCILSRMCALLGQPAEMWDDLSARTLDSIDRYFWREHLGGYGQYLYGATYPSLSPRTDALGQALVLLCGLSSKERQAGVWTSQPFEDFGVPTVFPQSAGIPPYHNQSVWPFVQAYWMRAAAANGDEDAVLYGIACMLRSSAMFLTNKENLVADTGTAAGTVENSDRQLWSVAGALAITYRILFGLQLQEDGLHICPVVPQTLGGCRVLHHYRYRDAVLHISVFGVGNTVLSVTMDGHAATTVVSPDLQGEHAIEVHLGRAAASLCTLELVPDAMAPETPVACADGVDLSWQRIDGAVSYRVYIDGVMRMETTATRAPFTSESYAEYQVAALSQGGLESFLSEPVVRHSYTAEVSVNPCGLYTELDCWGTSGLCVSTHVPDSGEYVVQFRYSNGGGAINTGDCCAVRSLFVDEERVGAIVMPQQGDGEWDNYGLSSRQVIPLSKGAHIFELRYTPVDENMNGRINRARISSLLLTLHKTAPTP